MAGRWRKDADRIGVLIIKCYKKSAYILSAIKRVLIIPKHIYLKILNEFKSVIKHVIKNIIKNVIKNVI